MLHVIATIEVVANRRHELLAAFEWLTPLVRDEIGCIEYSPAVDVPTTLSAQVPTRPDVLIVIEKWATLDALMAHTQAPHMVEYRAKVAGIVKTVSLQILTAAGA